VATVEDEFCVLPVSLEADVKAAAAQLARVENSSLNDVIVGELAAYFEIPYEPTGRPGSDQRTGSGVTQLRRIPLELRDRIEAEKRRLPAGTKEEPRSARAVIDRVLRARLGL
jgi:hypothetical protein